MRKLIMLSIIMILSLFNIAKSSEYTRVVGQVISVDLKESTVKVNVFSKVCSGIHIFSIKNDNILENIKPSSDIGLYLIKDCEQALIEEKK